MFAKVCSNFTQNLLQIENFKSPFKKTNEDAPKSKKLEFDDFSKSKNLDYENLKKNPNYEDFSKSPEYEDFPKSKKSYYEYFPKSKKSDYEDFPKTKKPNYEDFPKSKKPEKKIIEEDYFEPKKPPVLKSSEKFSQRRLSPKSAKRETSPGIQNDEIYSLSSRYTPDSPKEQNPKQKSLKFDYQESNRSKWKEPDSFVGYKEEPIQENFYSRDSELKGYSDYIPPGESFVYYESIPENPVKAKPQPYVPYYPVVDPLLAINSTNQQIKDLEDQLKEKNEIINQYKYDLENAKLDYEDLEEKYNTLGDLERRLKNLRVEKEMFERKAKNFEEENEDLHRQLDHIREDLENARFKVEDSERAYRNKISDMERELRNYKDRVSDLERDLSREKEKNTGRGNRRKEREKSYDDYNNDYRNDDRGYDRDYYDYQRNEYPPYEDKREKNYYEEDSYKPAKKEKKQEGQYYSEKPKKHEFYNENYQENFENFKPDKISEQVKAKIGAGNSSSISSILNWGEKPRKNEEVLNIENKILSLQIERKRYEEELAKIPEHGKKIAVIRRREEIENEIALIHSNIANLKIKAKQYQSDR